MTFKGSFCYRSTFPVTIFGEFFFNPIRPIMNNIGWVSSYVGVMTIFVARFFPQRSINRAGIYIAFGS